MSFLVFLRDDRGAGTTEFVLWVPPMLLFLLLVTDASILYLTHSDMFNITREAARQVSVGTLDKDDVPAFVQQRSLLGARTISVATYSGAIVVIELSVNVGDASIFGFFKPILGNEMRARVQMRREPTLVPPFSVPPSA